MALAETNRQDQAPITILGAGSWGTALAIQFARAGHAVRLWGRDPRALEALERDRCNRQYLPDAPFPPSLRVESELTRALSDAADVLIAVPSHGFRELLQQLKPHLQSGMRLAWATKGFEQGSGKLPHEVAAEVLGARWPIAVLSGPTFAREVGAGLPTAMTIASPDEHFAAAIAHNISGLNFRAYTSGDVIGVEVGGAVKNVLAIGAGIADGMGYGANTRIALITRGLAEMTRLGEALGARRETFMGLAGLGDLVLTCTDNQSRNRRFGLALAKGRSAGAVLAEIGQVVEGYSAAKAVHAVAARLGIEMPICAAAYRVLYEGLPIKQAVQELMAREIRPEHD
ncbi:MAG TPA: NAD(P)H-dependent glycerol-3-phosphate dehydrogenase [Steroidobacteraceae bacterium]|jgi:glycerol-3-phosphate dehydrogenase (NAD(P)+)|nr:NAD(P)H-dependent glycerol-3-phosphate dehydrogenase [Steroidobacteraceae bacterium]